MNILRLLLFLLLSLHVSGQAVYTNLWLTPTPTPTNGATPGSLIRRTGTFAPTLYGGPPIVYDIFTGGGYRSVSNATERLTIPNSRRKEGMMVFEAATTNLYLLTRDLTNWMFIGRCASNSFGNIYTVDGNLLTNRVLGGQGIHSLTFSGLTAHNVNADSITLFGALNSSVYSGQSLSLGSAVQLQLSAPDIYLASSNILHSAASPGWVLTLLDADSGRSEWQAPSGGSGQNVMNADLTADTSHSQDGDGNDMTFSNFNYWTFDVNNFTVSSYVTSVDADTIMQATSGGTKAILQKSGGINLVTGDGVTGLTNAFWIATSNYWNNSISPGAVLTVIRTNGQPGGITGVLVDFLPPTGGSDLNIGNSDLIITDPLRTLSGGGNDLLFTNLVNLEFYADTSAGLGSSGLARTYGQDAYLYAFSGSGFLAQNSGEATMRGPGNVIIQPPTIYAQTAVPGQVLTLLSTNGIADWASVAGSTNYFNITNTYIGNNVMNASLTATGTHTQDGNGTDLTFSNFNGFNISSSDLFLTAASQLKITTASGTGTAGQALISDGTYADWATIPAGQNMATDDLTLTGNRVQTGAGFDFNFNGVGLFTLSGNNMVLGGGGSFQIQTPNVVNLTASNGQVLTLTDASNGTVEFTTPASGDNISNANLTSDGDHTLDVDGHNLTIDNFLTATISATAASSITINHSKVELKATGSNKINLYSDAINASSATVGQVWTLQNATTGAGEWAAGTSPAGGNVSTIDTLYDITTESSPVVITQGYYVKGDGGHAAYRYVSGDASATNTVTVFAGLSGRYFLLQSGSISAKQAGVVGDGVTDDNINLQALFTACSGLTARIDPLNYYSSAGFTQVDDLKVIARGASLTIDMNGETGFKMGSRSTVDGGNWLFRRLSGGANGFDNSGFTFGNYTAAGSVSNSTLKNVYVNRTGTTASSAVFITGASENITIDTLEFPDSSTLDDVVTIHWGYVSGSESNGTLHPHNITVRNINVGSLTTSTADGSPIFCSAGYNILAENITSRRARHGAILVAGDFGFKYSGFNAQTLGSVIYRNVSCLQADNIGILVQSVGVSSQVYPQEFITDSCTIFGPNNGSNNGGFYLNTTRNFTARNCLMAGHLQGTTFTGGCLNTTFDHCTFATNYNQGIFLDDSSTVGVDILYCNFSNNARGKTGTNAAGIKLHNGSQARVIGCHFGNTTSESNQEVGLSVSSTFVNATVAGNYTYNVKSGGVNYAYHLGSTANANTHLYLVYDNQCKTGITLLSGPDNIPYASRRKYRMFTGNAAPTVGTYMKGDIITIDEATASPFELRCSVSGTPGTWITSY